MAPDLGVFAVADGMGGHAAGEVASRLAVDQVREAIAGDLSQRIANRYLDNPDLDTRRRVLARLSRVVLRVHEQVLKASQKDFSLTNMGTTLDVVWLLRDQAFVAHVGDGRIYLARRSAVLQLTEDHVEGPLGMFRHDGPTRSRRASRLARAVGVPNACGPDTLMVGIDRGDRLLMATDGIHSQIPDEAELGSLMRAETVADAAQSLVQRAHRVGTDDATALLIEICDRFAAHDEPAAAVLHPDLEALRESVLFAGLPWSQALVVLTIAVEVEVEAGQNLAWMVANDRVAYVLLEGLVSLPHGRQLGPGATIFAECLVNSNPADQTARCEASTRALRLRSDDLREICNSDSRLAAQLYRRLAEHLGRRLGG